MARTQVSEDYYEWIDKMFKDVPPALAKTVKVPSKDEWLDNIFRDVIVTKGKPSTKSKQVVTEDDGLGADTLLWPGERADLLCPEGACDGLLKLRSSKHGLFYGCTRYPACKGSHGAHPDGAPLGVPADKATKQARIIAHEFFDRLWGEEIMTKDAAYAWMAKQMRVPAARAHISFLNKDTCEVLVETIKGCFPQIVTVYDRLQDDELFWPETEVGK